MHVAYQENKSCMFDMAGFFSLKYFSDLRGKFWTGDDLIAIWD